MKTAWLIEHPTPLGPAYATPKGYPTFDPWQALGFETEEIARRFMKHPGECIPYEGEWRPVQHGFVET